MMHDALARRFGTPSYIYDRACIRLAHADLVAALPQPSRLYYSVKANPHPGVVAVPAALGCHAEVSSSGELAVALAAGFAPERVLMTGPAKSADSVEAAIGRGVHRFSVESPTDLVRVGAVAAREGVVADCLLRVNAERPVPGMGLVMTGAASQFGADASWIAARPDLFRAAGTRVVGLHLYMGANIVEPDRLLEQFSISLDHVVGLAGTVQIGEVDLGGGFAAPYARAGERPDYAGLARRLAAVLDARLAGWRTGRPLVSFESGRYLVADCGRLVCSVVDVKVSKGRTFVLLDAGIHQLGGMSGLRRLPRVVPDLSVPALRPIVADCVLAGPLCTPLDTWSSGVCLPQLRPGDLVAVPNVGAYGLTASLVAFLGHPLAAEIVVDGPALVSATRLTVQRTDLVSGADHRVSGVGG
jgi:diaminopimelate decarboxylase